MVRITGRSSADIGTGLYLGFLAGGDTVVSSEEEGFEVDGEPQEVKDHYLNGVIYTAGKFNNPVRHMVEPHRGNRTVLLMFFATKPVSQDQLKGN